MTKKGTFPIEEIACENLAVGMGLSCSAKPVRLEYRGQSRSEIEEIGKNKILPLSVDQGKESGLWKCLGSLWRVSSQGVV